MSPFEVFTTLISGAAHDVNHPGTNNAFEVKKGSELAYFYNDTSVLENMHAAFFFSIKNLLKNYFGNKLKHVRDFCVSLYNV